MSLLFGRDFNKSIILDREDLTAKYGLRSITISGDEWGEAVLVSQEIEEEESVTDIPLVNQVKKKCLEIDIKLMGFDEYNNPKTFSEELIREITRKMTGTKEVKELRIGDYFYYGYFIELTRKWTKSNQGYFICRFKMASPNCYTTRLLTEAGVENGEKLLEISNRSTGCEYVLPDIIINTQSDCSYIRIINLNDDTVFELKDIPINSKIQYHGDGLNQFTDKVGNEDFFKNWNLVALRLPYGKSTLKIQTDGKCSVGIIFQSEIALF